MPGALSVDQGLVTKMQLEMILQRAAVEASLSVALAGLGCSRGSWVPIGMSELHVVQDSLHHKRHCGRCCCYCRDGLLVRVGAAVFSDNSLECRS